MKENVTDRFPKYGFEITAPSFRIINETKESLSDFFRFADDVRAKVTELAVTAKKSAMGGEKVNVIEDCDGEFDLTTISGWERMLRFALRRGVGKILKDQKNIEIAFIKVELTS